MRKLGALRRTVLLVVVVLIFAILMGVSLWRIQGLQRTLSQPIPENILWAASQLELEMKATILALDAVFHVDEDRLAGETVESLSEDLQLQYDILWSRVSLFQSGTLREAVRDTPEAGATVDAIADLLVAFDPAIAQLPDVDEGRLTALLNELSVLADSVRSLTVTALHTDRKQRRSLREDAERAVYYGALAGLGMMLFGALLVVGLVRSDRKLRKSLEVANEARIEAEKATAAKSAFLAMMSHELRTPMNGVLGALGLVSESKLGEQQRSLVDVARGSAESLLTILNDILDFSKVEAGRLELEPHKFKLSWLTSSVLALCSPLAREKHIRIDLMVEPGIPDDLIGDSGRIKQMLVNLVGNAVKFTEIGGVQLIVTSIERDDHSTRLRFSIVDTGIGIPPDRQDAVFDSFNQADGSIARRYGGTGLGLTITRQMARLMGGDIGFDSIQNHGSTFWFDVPLEVAEQPSEVPADQAPAAASTEDLHPALREDLRHDGERPIRILLVEDNATNQMVIKLMIQKLGGHVDIAGNGQEAIESVASRPYDVVLMDISMPVMDGLEATAHIRQHHSTKLPILALTANAMKEDAERNLESGMQHCLTKPVQKPELVKAVQTYALDSMADGAQQPVENNSGGTNRDEASSSHQSKGLPAAQSIEIEGAGTHSSLSDIDDGPVSGAQGVAPEQSPAGDRDLLQDTSTDLWIDQETLQLMADDVGVATIDMILETFTADVSRLGAQFDAGLACGDTKNMQEAVHALSGSTATFGAPRLHELTRAIDIKLRRGDFESAMKDSAIVLKYCQETVAAFEGYREKLVAAA